MGQGHISKTSDTNVTSNYPFHAISASASDYCGPDFHAHSYSDLCTVGQFFLVLEIICIPIITVGSVLTIVTISLVKTFHTPHDYCLYYIAVVDLIIGVIYTPYNLVFLFPGTAESIRAHGVWPCSLWIHAGGCLFSLALDFLTIMCVDRFLMTFTPILHINHVKKRTMIKVHIAVAAVRILMHVALFTYNLIDWAGEAWSMEHCSWAKVFPDHFYYATLVLFFVEIVMCWMVCIAVVIKVAKIRRRNQDALGEQRDAWHNVALMCSLVLIFLVLWTPFGLSVVVADINTSVAIVFRLLNSAVNASIYAATRQDYRLSFKLLLTTPPWRWNTVQRQLMYRKSIFLVPALSGRSRRGNVVDLDEGATATWRSWRCYTCCRNSIWWIICLTCLGKESVPDRSKRYTVPPTTPTMGDRNVVASKPPRKASREMSFDFLGYLTHQSSSLMSWIFGKTEGNKDAPPGGKCSKSTPDVAVGTPIDGSDEQPSRCSKRCKCLGCCCYPPSSTTENKEAEVISTTQEISKPSRDSVPASVMDRVTTFLETLKTSAETKVACVPPSEVASETKDPGVKNDLMIYKLITGERKKSQVSAISEV